MKKITATLLVLLSLNYSQGQIIPPYLPQNGLVGWWPFNGNSNDESGNGNNGVVTGAVLTADRFGNFNKAFHFDGNQDYIECQDNASLQLDNFTISLWSFLEPSSNWGGVFAGGFFIHKGCDNIVEPYAGFSYRIFYQTPYGLSAEQFVNDRSGMQNNSVNMFGQWSNVVFTYDGNKLRLFNNGILIDSIARTGITIKNNYNLLFGARLQKNTNGVCFLDDFFTGVLDDISIWNRPLSQGEITQIYTSTGGGNVGVNVTSPQRNLHVNDVLKMEPRNTSPANPSKGDIYYDGVINKLRVYDGTQWQNCW